MTSVSARLQKVKVLRCRNPASLYMKEALVKRTVFGDVGKHIGVQTVVLEVEVREKQTNIDLPHPAAVSSSECPPHTWQLRQCVLLTAAI